MRCYASNPSAARQLSDFSTAAQAYLLARCGYSQDHPAVMLLRMDGRAGPRDKAISDPYGWGDRTMHLAHLYITTSFDELADGDVVDVEFIAGETLVPKKAEWRERA